MRKLTLLATTWLAIAVVPALAQISQCRLGVGPSCSGTAGDDGTPSVPPSLTSALAASDPAVQAELARVLAMARQARAAAALASEQVQAEVADIQARWARIQAQGTQGPAQGRDTASPSPVPAGESSP